ncbi:MAG: Alanine--tRNA ligase [candidate division TA06 bacterium ADurb.Bin417]|uniref:Alanine--tRNA ligase n=1 Tax=candidate division TA06 bacterium ADurb.Bin417 TaxID=1852828 RepID=A0A1V5ML01_UNCT6|nr:MAG: Alanine--tRNA ligase [candidate division TA06 bacterium ADurb.Bin417]
MRSSEIRNVFLEFFRSREHVVVPGIPLVPPEDPTLLFTSAGMVPFKNFWAGNDQIPFVRAVSVQRCLRAGGKDSDLDNVGLDSRHHTFFEMLGNFSFGDYFKTEAIDFAWEFLMQRLRLPESKLWVSVYQDDGEAAGIWKKYVRPERIVKLGARDNFWGPAGETGVCGPCSEIYFDRGPGVGCGRPDCAPGCDCDRYLEFWNLVFPQFNKAADGTLLPLARRGVDTGMGLERISALCQEAPSNFETDLFQPIINRLVELTGRAYPGRGEEQAAFRAVADHVRALTFAIAENIMPANEGRGYVIRRILRRAVKFLRVLQVREPVLHRLVPEVVGLMKEAYPHLAEREKFTAATIAAEEERFLELLTEGRRIFRQLTVGVRGRTVPGRTVFQLYDTHGLPLETIREIAGEAKFSLDEAGFEAELENQRAASRQASAFEGVPDRTPLAGLSPTRFAGYDREILETLVGAVIPLPDGSSSLVLTETPFYPERGGQLGDRGEIGGEHFKFEVRETRVDEAGFIHHLGRFSSGRAEAGVSARAVVDRGHRRRTAANHTATHLLHAALREVLGDEVKQAGSLVADEYLRFDFTWNQELDRESLGRVEALVNQVIQADLSVFKEEQALADAVNDGAVALFTEKYGEKVRVVTMGDFSKEVCGGVHLENTGSLGLFVISATASVGKGIRRIEALVGAAAYRWLKERSDYLVELGRRLKIEPLSLAAELDRYDRERQESRVRLNAFFGAYLESEVGRLEASAVEVGGRRRPACSWTACAATAAARLRPCWWPAARPPRFSWA